MTHCTIPTFVNVFAGNLFIRLVSKVFMECKLYMGMLNAFGSKLQAYRYMCDVIANGILQICGVREAGQVIIYIAARWHFPMYERVQ